ncbi:uncharacterized protein [Pocillopora verrucosa]|uniref:uncharacterized protein n=1 Tax=Pocillopora verrucosa TaxID=203993 RepID=UPI00333E7986
MDEGPISVSDMVISKCTLEDKTTEVNDGFFLNTRVPKWKEITQENSTLKVKFDMETDLAREVDSVGKIEKNMTREVRFTGGRWFTADEYGKFHLYSGYRNGKSGELRNHKLSIFGLVLTYNSKYGSLDLIKEDFNESKRTYPTLREEMIGFPLAHLTVTQSNSFHDSVKRGSAPSPAVTPCNVKWSNALRLDPTTTGGRCLHFTASSAGDFFVVFATIPSRRSSWYYVQIGVSKVAIYKGEREVTSTSDTGSVSIGDALLYQSYFVCLYEKPNSTLIEYGKSLGTSDGGDIYLTHLDANDPLPVRFYAFGNMDKVVKIWDAHIIPRDLTDADCKESTYKDPPTNLCFLKCHEYCDPFVGCKNAGAKDLQPSDCLACRIAKDPKTNVCLEKCPENTQPNKNKECLLTFDAMTVVGGVGGVKVQDMPALNHMTLCLWTKFPQTSVSGLKMTSLASYFDTSGKIGFSFNIVEYNSEEGKMMPLLPFRRMKTLHFSSAFLDDNDWHRLCITWNGVTGVTKVYVDGVQNESAEFGKYAVEGLIKDSLPGGGTLEVLAVYSQVVYVSELNLWDKPLSAVEISESSKLCFGKQGNVKKWSDFWPGFSKDKSRYEGPSQCKSPYGSSEEMMEEGLVVSEKTPFPLNAKKRRAFKYTRKGQKNPTQ